jgi:hypothetical protein
MVIVVYVKKTRMPGKKGTFRFNAGFSNGAWVQIWDSKHDQFAEFSKLRVGQKIEVEADYDQWIHINGPPKKWKHHLKNPRITKYHTLNYLL